MFRSCLSVQSSIAGEENLKSVSTVDTSRSQCVRSLVV